MVCAKKCLGVFFKLAIKETDSILQVKRKKLAILVCLSIFSLISVLLTYSGRPFSVICVSIAIGMAVFVLFWICLLHRQVTDQFILFIAIITSSSIIFGDLGSAIVQENRQWPVFVLLVDVLLVSEAPSSISLGVVALCCFWILLTSVESTIRFGLYDARIQGSPSFETRNAICSCSTLPCPLDIGPALGTLTSASLIFVVDFMCTRGFAAAVLEEKNNILASIDAANLIAGSLSRFDLETAAEQLNNAVIPAELKMSFSCILQNLRSYRPYLPQSCFRDSSSEEEVEEDNPDHSCGSGSGNSGSSSTALSGSQKSRISIVNLRRPFESRVVSLLVANVRNSVLVFQSSNEHFSSLVSVLVTTISDIINKNKGNFDLFLGDRVFANFGATRMFSSHADSCISAAERIVKEAKTILTPFHQYAGDTPLSMNVGMGCGRLACGDLGSDNSMRFSVIGRHSHLVVVVERAGSLLGIDLVCESGMHRLVKTTYEIRVCFQAFLYNDELELLYEIIPTSGDVEVSEWMYQLENSGAGKWDIYNKIASAFLTGGCLSNVEKLKCDSIADLQSVMDNGAPDPLIIQRR